MYLTQIPNNPSPPPPPSYPPPNSSFRPPNSPYPAPTIVTPAATLVIPGPHHRHSGEGRNPEGRRGARQPLLNPSEANPPSQERRPPNRHSGPHHIVIPAKAGIQRGGEGRGSPSSIHRRPTHPPKSAGPPIVIPAPTTSSFRRRPESRGAVGGAAIPRPTTHHGQPPVGLGLVPSRRRNTNHQN